MRFVRSITRRAREQSGSASIFVIGMAVVLFVCAGLVIDGGVAINARMRVADDAEQASRIGADSLDVGQLRETGVITIDTKLADKRAAAYLGDRGYAVGQYAVDVENGTVKVSVKDTTQSVILGIVGITHFNVSASATSTPETG
jgi:Flp pilus assembly protein TadG